MTAWHHSRRADLSLRAAGLALLALAGGAFSHLGISYDAGMGACGFAAVGFLAASIGAALLLLGGHLFDEIEVSPRWRSRPAFRVPGEGNVMSIDLELASLLVIRDRDGTWIVRAREGLLLGRFASALAAQRFAESSRSPASMEHAGFAGRTDERPGLGPRSRTDAEPARG